MQNNNLCDAKKDLEKALSDQSKIDSYIVLDGQDLTGRGDLVNIAHWRAVQSAYVSDLKKRVEAITITVRR